MFKTVLSKHIMDKYCTKSTAQYTCKICFHFARVIQMRPSVAFQFPFQNGYNFFVINFKMILSLPYPCIVAHTPCTHHCPQQCSCDRPFHFSFYFKTVILFFNKLLLIFEHTLSLYLGTYSLHTPLSSAV